MVLQDINGTEMVFLEIDGNRVEKNLDTKNPFFELDRVLRKGFFVLIIKRISNILKNISWRKPSLTELSKNSII